MMVHERAQMRTTTPPAYPTFLTNPRTKPTESVRLVFTFQNRLLDPNVKAILVNYEKVAPGD